MLSQERNSFANESKEKTFSLCREQKGVALQNEARTRDPSIDKQCCILIFLGKVVLYQLSYFRICFTYSAHFWLRSLRERKLSLSPVRKFHKTYINKKRQLMAVLKSGKRGSNSRPQPWQGCALPTELFPHLIATRLFGFTFPCQGWKPYIFAARLCSTN